MSLSPQELRVLQLIAEGKSNGEIGLALGCRINLRQGRSETVHTHTRRILAKLRARNQAHAVAIGYRFGLID